MRFFKFLLFITLLFTACKNDTTNTNQEVKSKVSDSLKLTPKEVSKINFKDIGLDSKTNTVISNWQAYLNIVNGIENLKTADFTFFNTDIDVFNSSLKDFENTIPEAINSKPVKARVLVLKTMLYKFHEIESLITSTKNEKLQSIQDVFVALSNLNLQINKKVEKDSQVIIKPY